MSDVRLIIAHVYDAYADHVDRHHGLVHLFSRDASPPFPLCRAHVSDRVGLRVVAWFRKPLTCLWCVALLAARPRAA